MATFALISEGVTDHIIIESLIHRVCEESFQEGIDVNPLQPLRDATDKTAAPHAGWELVLEYCENKITDALQTNDYVIVHIDTDACDHPNFGVPLVEAGADRKYVDLVEDVESVIKSKIGKEVIRDFGERFIFAISVHSMESWILLCLFNMNEPKNSLNRLNRALRKKNFGHITKSVKDYQKIVKNFKRKEIIKHMNGKHSLGLFLQKLLV